MLDPMQPCTLTITISGDDLSIPTEYDDRKAALTAARDAMGEWYDLIDMLPITDALIDLAVGDTAEFGILIFTIKPTLHPDS